MRTVTPRLQHDMVYSESILPYQYSARELSLHSAMCKDQDLNPNKYAWDHIGHQLISPHISFSS